MMFNAPLLACAASVSLLTVAAPAQAQTKMLPGLWEHRFTVQDNSGQMAAAMKQMQEQMAGMTPAQRQQMEQMMGGKGVGMGAASGGANTLQLCMTQAQVDMNELPQPDKNCTHQAAQRSGNTLKVKFRCGGSTSSDGESEVTILSPTTYKGKTTVNSLVNGKPERMNMEQSGKWLSADCGNIKPLAPATPTTPAKK